MKINKTTGIITLDNGETISPNRVEPFNTNNDWGFAGGIGKMFYYDHDCSVRSGKAYYRHGRPESFIRYFIGSTEKCTLNQLTKVIS